ncbi:MAG: EAL domain-containing protein [Eubacteriales bacterium]|nr:EAL domain-containing protein [Eubacteriales bacterium]MDD3883283.1 EAL domain-containing protein [Eubacteriales bacterium]MDD4513902.1 EAL domain-containing protein [Eubacteriales bacterium]
MSDYSVRSSKPEQNAAGHAFAMEPQRAVLIVDDEQINRTSLKQILDSLKTDEAATGREALQKLRSSPESYILVLLDIILPDFDGYAVLQEMKADKLLRDIPVIIATQMTEEADEIKALALGAADYITKPYRPELIRHRVLNLIHLRESSLLVTEAERDPVTGVLNKESFLRHVEQELKKPADTRRDIICFDIERFKIINDIAGTSVGDEILAYAVTVIRDSFAEIISFGRIGPDVFSILIPSLGEYSDEMFAEISRRINEFPINISLTMDAGIYHIHNLSVTVSVMCDRARLALQTVKGKYRLFHAVYNDAIRQKMMKEQFITDRMKEALALKQFHVFLQPKYDIHSKLICGAEALVRWIHPERGFISPGEFIPVFEKNGFIFDLDRYVWEETCRLIRSWLDAGLTVVPISVNVSRVDIYHSELTQLLSDMTERYGIPTELLHLEITETAYTENSRQMVETLKMLKAHGFVIEMDDFGSGYSSLNMLSELPIDILKLDLKLVQSSIKSGGKNILSFIISLAKWLRLTAIAEGVETEEQLKMLAGMDCDQAQGYLFAHPMPDNEFMRLLKQGGVAIAGVDDLIEDAKVEKTELSSPPSDIMLVVDDVEICRRLMRVIFSDKYIVVEKSSGDQALLYMQEHYRDISVVMLDLIMPVMDGFQVLSCIQADSRLKSIPVIVTSQPSEDSEARALEMGAADFIAKPYNTHVARHRVDNVVDSAKLRHQKRIIESKYELLQEAYRDPLTGLFNRRGLERGWDELPEEIEGFYALYMIDIDNLKHYNDNFGHAQGDEVLKACAKSFRSILRSNDIVARIGGDEFVTVAGHMPSIQSAKERGLRLCDACKSVQSAYCRDVTCSVGVAIFRRRPKDLTIIMNAADRMMYRAKQTGKDACEVVNIDE